MGLEALLPHLHNELRGQLSHPALPHALNRAKQVGTRVETLLPHLMKNCKAHYGPTLPYAPIER